MFRGEESKEMMQMTKLLYIQNEHMKMGKITPTIAIAQRGRSVKSIPE